MGLMMVKSYKTLLQMNYKKKYCIYPIDKKSILFL